MWKDFKEHLRAKGFEDASIEDDLRFTLDHGYLMGFPNKNTPSHIRLRNRIAYEIRYLLSLANSDTPPGVSSSEISVGTEVRTLSELDARVLFAIWEIEYKTNRPPSSEVIQQATGLSKPKLEKIFYRLQAFPWPIMTTFTSSETQRAYRIAHNRIVGWPRHGCHSCAARRW